METNGPKLVETLWAMVAVSLVFLILRLFCKRRCRVGFTLDDHLMVFSWITFTIFSAFTTASVKYGLGSHITEISQAHFVIMLKYILIGEFFGLVALSIGKTSFAVTLLRLTPRRRHKWLLWYIIVSLNLTMALCAITVFFWCSPPRKSWDASVPGTCLDHRHQSRYAIFTGAYSALVDILLAGLAWLMIWKLRINKKEKVGVALAMSLGILAGIAAAIKTAYVLTMARWQDFTYSCYILFIWVSAEAALTVVATSIPYLRLLVKNVVLNPNDRCDADKNQDTTSKYTGQDQQMSGLRK